MPGISRLTVALIQSHPDEVDGDGIGCDGAGPYPNGKFAGWITLWRDKRPHISPLLSTEPVYDSVLVAKEAMQQFVNDIRKDEGIMERTMPLS